MQFSLQSNCLPRESKVLVSTRTAAAMRVCVFAACVRLHNGYMQASHAINATYAHTRQLSDGLKPKSYSLVDIR